MLLVGIYGIKKTKRGINYECNSLVRNCVVYSSRLNRCRRNGLLLSCVGDYVNDYLGRVQAEAGPGWSQGD